MNILITLGGIVIFLIILGIIIAVHEGGHFLFAKRAGILAREFAFGMGPVLWKKKKGETTYAVRAFPIGGFVAIAGEELEDDPFAEQKNVKLEIIDGLVHNIYFDVVDTDEDVYEVLEYDVFDKEETGKLYLKVLKDGVEEVLSVSPVAMVHLRKLEYQIAPYNRTIGSKSKRARALVMFGGPLMNFLLAFLVFFVASLISGHPNTSITTFNTYESSQAYMAGLRDGDTITFLESSTGSTLLTVDDAKEWKDISSFMEKYKADNLTGEIEVKVDRGGQELSFFVTPSLSINNLALEVIVVDEGLKVINFTEADDELIYNKSFVSHYSEDMDLIITKFRYNGDDYLATNIKEVYKLFEEDYIGKSKTEELNKVEISFTIGGEEKTAKVVPYNKEVMNYLSKRNGISPIKIAIGISPLTKFSLGKSFIAMFTNTLNSGLAVFSTLGMLFRGGVGLRSLSGFVGIASETVRVTRLGFVSILTWTGLLSVNIGLLNLLPIPALDGGRLVFLGYEAITRRKPSQKVETILIVATMFLLFGLMIFVTFNDIIKLF